MRAHSSPLTQEKHSPRLVLGPFNQILVNPWPIALEKLMHSGFRNSVLLFVLESFKCLEVPATSIFESWYRQLGQQALGSKGLVRGFVVHAGWIRTIRRDNHGGTQRGVRCWVFSDQLMTERLGFGAIQSNLGTLQHIIMILSPLPIPLRLSIHHLFFHPLNHIVEFTHTRPLLFAIQHFHPPAEHWQL